MSSLAHLRSVLFVAGLAVAASAGVEARGVDLKGVWRTASMRADGVIDEWRELTAVTKELSAGAANDADTLEIALVTRDPGLRQRLLVGGLAISLDPAGGKARTFVIRIPSLGGRPGPDEPPSALSVTYFEVLGPGKTDERIVELTESRGIDLAVTEHEGSLIVELALPLRSSESRPLAPGIAAGQRVIGLGLATPDPPEAGRGRSGDGRRGGGGMSVGGGRGGSTGRPSGGGFGARRGDDSDRTGKGLNVWTTITMAAR